LAEVPKPPASIWPLITVLIALLAIGGMLVMYFVLKH
jgi:flagellar basal body-associated protein FliL